MENNSLSRAMFSVALSNAMNDQVFRQIIGMKLLSDENRGNDGVGMALLMNNNPIIQPPTLGNNYRKNY